MTHPRLTLSEARLLAAVADLQQMKTCAASCVLKTLVSQAGVKVIVPPLAGVAGCLAARGHHLPVWNPFAA